MGVPTNRSYYNHLHHFHHLRIRGPFAPFSRWACPLPAAISPCPPFSQWGCPLTPAIQPFPPFSQRGCPLTPAIPPFPPFAQFSRWGVSTNRSNSTISTIFAGGVPTNRSYSTISTEIQIWVVEMPKMKPWYHAKNTWWTQTIVIPTFEHLFNWIQTIFYPCFSRDIFPV